MFIGHFGIGLGAKKAAPKISLGTFFLAAQFLDLLWPTFLLFGWESVKIEPGITKMTPLNFTHYPISHSLLMAIVWGFIFGVIYFLIKRNFKGSIILGLVVISHWVLDLFVHIPDLPLYPGSHIYLGLGLWNHEVFAIALEGLIFISGLVIYLNSTKSKNKVGKYGFWGMIFLLVLIYISNLFGSPPPNIKAIAWAGELQWIFVLWAFWVDKNRISVLHETKPL
jgi:FtsH-binding integral membrane protein